MTQVTKGKINVVGCGGTGANVVSRIEELASKNYDGFADISTYYVDTSVSNLIGTDIPREKFYQIDGKEGSGAIRSENSAEIKDSAPTIAHKICGADLIILVASAGGGSGSVISPLLARILMDKDQQFIVFLVGSAETVTYARNTKKTIESFDGAVQTKNKSLTLAYFQNSAAMKRADVDRRIFNMISSLAVLYSRQNKEMDPQDLRNWLRFERATSSEAQLSVLNIIGNQEEHFVPGNLLSLATLTTDDLDTNFGNELVEYQTIGYFQAKDDEMRQKLPLHFTISDGILREVTDDLDKMLEKFGEAKQAAPKKKPLANVAKLDEDGMSY